MGYIKEKVAYVQGLADGLALEESSKEGRVLSAILDILDEMADSVEENEAAIVDMNECVERLVEDSEALNEIMFGGDDCKFECPACGEIVDIEPDDLDSDDELLCPKCEKPLFPDFLEDD